MSVLKPAVEAEYWEPPAPHVPARCTALLQNHSCSAEDLQMTELVEHEAFVRDFEGGSEFQGVQAICH